MSAAVSQLVRRHLVVRGTVQGVGFRPYLARLAADLGLSGSCHNDEACVEVEIEGPAADVARFEERLTREAPPLARIVSVTGHDAATTGATEFAILASTHSSAQRTTLPPDTAPCADCLREMNDPADRRYRHPFITCTHCGPRLTITLDLPYDRATTTMADFAMCPACEREYGDPLDRRYHAQPIGCHDCGPSISLVDSTGVVGAVGTEPVLDAVGAALRAGAIVAIKGIGGYHLACDARNADAVALLRSRKHRPDQPFAVMVRDLHTARALVSLPPRAEDLLTSPERPIVLLPARADATVTASLAPGLHELGIVLPYTPLHHLVLDAGPDCLVMTSGNASGEPLCYDDADALTRLGGADPVADLLLVHDRPIAVPVEDSVIAWTAGGPVPVRRSRGYAPIDLPLGAAESACVLAAGAEVKNTVALARDGRAYLSAHVGDLASLASREAHQRVSDQLLRFHRGAPALLVADAHPGYASRAWAQRFATDLAVPLMEVQHHHAHLASLAAEHDLLAEPLLGLVLDGTGYGCDGLVWGGELLLLTDRGRTMRRLGHLGTVRLPGADAGVRNPVRTAALALLDAGLDLAAPEAALVAAELSAAEASFLTGAAASGSGLVETSSAGRLFDVAASLLGVRHRISYEAQAAIEVEALAHYWLTTEPGNDAPVLPLPVRHHAGAPGVIDPAPLVRALAEAVADGVDRGALAWAFHGALADAVAELAAHRAPAGTRRVGLSGGVYVNRVLLAATTQALRTRGLDALTHQSVPANDGGLALGQVAVGVSTLAHRATTNPNPTAAECE